MNTTKLFEIRDRATFIPCVGMLMKGNSEREDWLIGRAGYSPSRPHYVLFGRLDGEVFRWDPYDWPNRTMGNAHKYITSNWADLNSGDLIDVEFILGESDEKKITEQNRKYY